MTDYLKLTAYLGERLRHQDRLASEALLDLFAHDSVAASVVLRGAEGFGPSHQLRSDQSLSGSDDLPVAIAAVDDAEKIARLADRAVDIVSRGMITLERARVVEPSTTDLAEVTKLTIYVGRQQRLDGRPAYRAVCDLLYERGFDSATVFLGVDGTVRGERRRARFFGANTEVPVMIIAVGTAGRVAAVTPRLQEVLSGPLMTVERVQLCKRDGTLITRPRALPPADAAGRPTYQKLMIHTSESELHRGEPVHRAIVRRIRADPPSRGVTVLRGIWGFHGEHEPHGDKLFQLGRDVPVTTIIVDSPDRLATSFAEVDELTEQGVITAELVPALVSIDGGQHLGSTALARFD